MASAIRTISQGGPKGTQIDVECHLSNGLPNIVIVGLGGKAVDEAKERIRSAFAASNLALPRKRIVINLAPADLPKEGSDFDLPIAIAILSASGQINLKALSELFLGELGLDGSLRQIRGIIGKIIDAKNLGVKSFYIPSKNLHQAQLVPGIKIYPVDNLKQLYLHLSDTSRIMPINSGNGLFPTVGLVTKKTEVFEHVVGQPRAKRALEVAAAGQHNILLTGAPGTGKSMLAKALPSILPKLRQEEMIEVTQLHSLAGEDFNTIVTERPFRSPHHSASSISIIGGGQKPKPGEISLSHHGVLFLDELPEFPRSVIEALRQPLEDRIINVARAKESLTFPANFIMVSTANPCPCGHFGSTKTCVCLPTQIINYQRKLSGPILDRIDLYIEVDEVPHERLLAKNNYEEPSSNIKPRVAAARDRQFKRQNKLNSELTNQEIKKISGIKPESQELLNQAAVKLQLSPRSYIRSIRVARTIADLAGSPTIDLAHISEALQYRHQPVML